MNSDKPRILIVEDDLSVVEGLVRGLSKAGFDVTVAMDGEEGLELVLGVRFELLILDLMLPSKTGHDILKEMSGRISIPVVVLSARTELEARLTSFQLGAVDFVPKPFWIEELVARIRSRLALREDGPHRIISFGGVDVDLDSRRAMRDGKDIQLTTHEFNALAYLLERPDRAVTRTQIGEQALSDTRDRVDRTVDSHMSRVRKKLQLPASACIQTVWGIGYRFNPSAKE